MFIGSFCLLSVVRIIFCQYLLPILSQAIKPFPATSLMSYVHTFKLLASYPFRVLEKKQGNKGCSLIDSHLSENVKSRITSC